MSEPVGTGGAADLAAEIRDKLRKNRVSARSESARVERRWAGYSNSYLITTIGSRLDDGSRDGKQVGGDAGHRSPRKRRQDTSCLPARRLTQPSPDGHQGIGSGLAAATQDCHRAIAGAI